MMSREIIRESDKTVRLCCGKKGCPTVTDVGEGMVEITDDDGNKIVVKKEEAELISDGVRTLDGKKLICG
tara:strand:- start:229 stop:438 length:210 start_codon:yes stop_codon:yes gene_type:complete